MLAFIKNLSLLLITTGLFVSCNTLQIKDPSKQMVRPGLPTQTAQISYSFSMATSEEIKIRAISLLRNGSQTAINNFVLMSLPDGKLLKPEATFGSGDYYVSFKTGTKDININDSDSIEIRYVASGKTKSMVIVPLLKSEILSK
jgi:hypothetical protein